MTQQLTPRFAKELLDADPVKPVDASKVAEFAHAIFHGLWRDEPTLLVLRADGALLDGVHRCVAVIVANRSIPVEIDVRAHPAAAARLTPPVS